MSEDSNHPHWKVYYLNPEYFNHPTINAYRYTLVQAKNRDEAVHKFDELWQDKYKAIEVKPK